MRAAITISFGGCGELCLFDRGDWGKNVPMLKMRTVIGIFVGALTLLTSTLPLQAEETASVRGPEASPMDALPQVISLQDVERYRHIFAFQAKADWKSADREIARLEDPLLLGHLQAQRYLHPTGYRSSFGELQSWLKVNADHPQAQRIYALAKRKGGKNAKLVRPSLGLASASHGSPDGARWEDSSFKRYSGNAKGQWNQFTRAIRQGATLSAKKVLTDAATQKLIHPVDLDRMAGALGFKYFVDGNNDLAMEWAGRAADRSGVKAPMALWGAGLAFWRAGQYEKAGGYFEALGQSEHSSSWMRAAGGFWAARAYLKGRHPEKVSAQLETAATFPRTFYGLLASKALGQESKISWQTAPVIPEDLAGIVEHKIGRRAVALLQLGHTSTAEQELRRLHPVADAKTSQAIFSLADAAQLPNLAYRLALRAEQNGDDTTRASALYPVPDWLPDGGWRVDKALVLAFVRQESAFNPEAKSYRGARGLMQLMPATASFIARNRKYKSSGKDDLFDPTLNLALGQQYLQHLLGHELVNNNLFLLAAAYNGGPGNLKRWIRQMEHGDDPLMFIESLPSRETRIFIERVLSNYWIYRLRMDQPTPSLVELAGGAWPNYAPVDLPSNQLAQNARH